jgi:hypothetical protein
MSSAQQLAMSVKKYAKKLGILSYLPRRVLKNPGYLFALYLCPAFGGWRRKPSGYPIRRILSVPFSTYLHGVATEEQISSIARRFLQIVVSTSALRRRPRRCARQRRAEKNTAKQRRKSRVLLLQLTQGTNPHT